jgi:threonylcarbamoyladenosine tRNA methylthiotransferase MtaB
MRRALVALETLGCKLNQAESESLGRQLRQVGFQLISSPEDAEVYILNTCTVTRVADRKARQRVRQVRRGNRTALIAAVGCYVDRSAGDLLGAGADLVLDNSQKEQLPDLLRMEVDRRGSCPEHPVRDDYLGRTRTLVKIQSGCESSCNFCIVPQVRGEERCVPAEDVVREVGERAAEGYREAVLTGTKIGCYWWEGVGGLASLVEEILAETEVERLRLSSLQPQELTPQLLRLWEDRRLCNHLHVALQSGSDNVLHRMGRRYSTADFRSAAALAREMIPGVSITTDVMVGFPGETAEEFEESYRFCEEMGFARMHIFPYSSRPGTAAERMSRQVDEVTRRYRAQRMTVLAGQSAHRFAERFLGQTMLVLWEQETQKGIWNGLTGNYLRVFASSDGTLGGQCMPARLEYPCDGGIWGDLAEVPAMVCY